MKGNNLKVIVSGGGTGGHIFPAISIANAVKEQHPDAEILFVGAEGRMEMQRVPDAGYKIIGWGDLETRFNDDRYLQEKVKDERGDR